jgi:hypothetical protein
MKLKYQEEINKIKNCPEKKNELGEKVFYRCVEKAISQRSFIPVAEFPKPKRTQYCNAWGLSLYTDLDKTKEVLNSLSKNKYVKYEGIAFATINNEHGLKYNDNDKKHYTFFPEQDVDLMNIFTPINEDE